MDLNDKIKMLEDEIQDLKKQVKKTNRKGFGSYLTVFLISFFSTLLFLITYTLLGRK
ncbi:hypothetical protein [Aneurinibacillus aneurinilyticus]|uniref:Uncharacterized protein n=1 Tax=Aneurinibacillus aneurinilyticus TaxID=1391 RepID=A0A848D3X3_ANEAE|nr:hypothetical protein [Aneurinibacillus aneurinilyticus]NMF01500.1 hypothetical protein [Aneurinibacillus aneurinilyticus]